MSQADKVDWNTELQRFVGGQAQVSFNNEEERKLIRTDIIFIECVNEPGWKSPHFHMRWSHALDITDLEAPKTFEDTNMKTRKLVSAPSCRIVRVPNGRIMILNKILDVVVILYPAGDPEMMDLDPLSSR